MENNEDKFFDNQINYNDNIFPEKLKLNKENSIKPHNQILYKTETKNEERVNQLDNIKRLSNTIILNNIKRSEVDISHSDKEKRSVCSELQQKIKNYEDINKNYDFANISNNPENNQIICDNCKNTFEDCQEFENHLGACFFQSDLESNQNLNDSLIENFEIKNTKEEFNQNLNLEKSTKINIDTDRQNNLNIEEEKFEDKGLNCMKCNAVFTEFYKFEIHMKNCDGIKYNFSIKKEEKLIKNDDHFNNYNNLIEKDIESNFNNNYLDEKFSSQINNNQIEKFVKNDIHFHNFNYLIEKDIESNSFNKYSENKFSSQINNNQNNEEEEEEKYFEEEENNSNDLDDSNVSYDRLIELDENIINPLGEEYIIQLNEEKITKEFLKKLNIDNKNCLICMENFNENDLIFRLPCLHFFHKAEIIKWFHKKKTCPICRSDVEDLLTNF